MAEIFTEVLVAPSFDDEALAVLTAKKNVRLLTVDLAAIEAAGGAAARETRPVSGGLLVQDRDRVDAVVRDAEGAVTGGDDPAYWRLVAGPAADEATLADLAFAWRAVRAVKSNAILLARDGASVGIGMGQVNRVDSCRLAVERAGAERVRGAVAASDAFFPFADGPGGCSSTRASRRSSRRAGRCATRRASTPARPQGWGCTSPGPVTSRTEDPARCVPTAWQDGAP